jgi:hypothetical protein
MARIGVAIRKCTRACLAACSDLTEETDMRWGMTTECDRDARCPLMGRTAVRPIIGRRIAMRRPSAKPFGVSRHLGARGRVRHCTRWRQMMATGRLRCATSRSPATIPASRGQRVADRSHAAANRANRSIYTYVSSHRNKCAVRISQRSLRHTNDARAITHRIAKRRKAIVEFGVQSS